MGKRGRKAGSYLRGSIPWHCLQLVPGKSLLVPDNDTDHHMVHLDLTLRRLEARAPGKWKVQTCYGLLSDMKSEPFKFFRITRIN
jgi:hypothetical protein